MIGVECMAKRKCIICGCLFDCPPSSGKITCSPECSRKHRQDLHRAGVYDQSMPAMRAKNPAAKSTENNPNAELWVIKSPDGIIYECHNLMLWLQSHQDLIDGTPRQAWDGISKIKYSMQGKRKNPSKSWKGWTLVAWGDHKL